MRTNSNGSAGVPETARQLAAELADAFETNRGLAEQLTGAQHRLQAANGRLWSGVHPDALGLVYGDSAAVGVGQGSSEVAEEILDAVAAGWSEEQARSADVRPLAAAGV